MLQILSLDDCHKLVRKNLGDSSYKLLSFTLDPLDGKSGFLGEHSILRIRLKSSSKCTELRYFVKSLPEVQSQKDFVHNTGAFFKEEKMFLEIVPHFLDNGVNIIAECVPKCFLVQRSEVFVFEDLSARGYKILDHRESYDLAKTKMALDAIVKLHASGLILEEKLTKNRSEPYRLNVRFQKEFREVMFTKSETSIALMEATKKGVITHIDLFPDPASPLPQDEFKNLAQLQIEKLRDFVAPSQQFRNTICHGDLWATNMMFKFDGNDKPIHCYLVDFQLYRYCPPAQDVLGLIHLTTDRKFREENLEHALLYYYRQLADVLLANGIQIKEVITYEEFRESCDYYRLYAVTQAILLSEAVMMSSEDLREFFAVPEYSQKILYEDRSEMIVRLCQSDPMYRKRMQDTICDLRDVCEEIFQRDK